MAKKKIDAKKVAGKIAGKVMALLLVVLMLLGVAGTLIYYVLQMI